MKVRPPKRTATAFEAQLLGWAIGAALAFPRLNDAFGSIFV